jgi:hypothetical protein
MVRYVYICIITFSTARDGISKLLRSPGIDSASLCSLAGCNDNPNPTMFLAFIDRSKIPALYSRGHHLLKKNNILYYPALSSF